MTDLLSQLQSATEGSRELDAAIYDLLDGSREPYPMPHFDVPNARAPHYTTNLQDAVSLVPEGWWVDSLYEMPGMGWDCDLRANYPARLVRASTKENGRYEDKRAFETGALALCIAIIKAHESKAEDTVMSHPAVRAFVTPLGT